MSKPTTLLACVVNCAAILICAATCAAQGAQPSPRGSVAPPAAAASPAPSPTATTNATGEPDLSITANVYARELLFEVVPTPKVEFPGRPRRDTVWEAERTNLPPQVQPGVTYRDIGIRLKITSVFADIERIVAEALGEIPASDDAPPKTNSNENAPPPDGNARPTTGEAAQPVEALPSTSSTQTSHAPSPSSRTRRAGGRSGGAQARRERP
ncbi:MAG: hypothetical protein LC803_12565 [Acidobacteria bacterium]|nr:hypothetical protein [Acidobacteriota bacterium]